MGLASARDANAAPCVHFPSSTIVVTDKRTALTQPNRSLHWIILLVEESQQRNPDNHKDVVGCNWCKPVIRQCRYGD